MVSGRQVEVAQPWEQAAQIENIEGFKRKGTVIIEIKRKINDNSAKKLRVRKIKVDEPMFRRYYHRTE